MGRHKIAMEKIRTPHNRHICFSKRRRGLFNKARDLALRGCHIAVIVFSAFGNAYTFSYPDLDHFRTYFTQKDSNIIDNNNGEAASTAMLLNNGEDNNFGSGGTDASNTTSDRNSSSDGAGDDEDIDSIDQAISPESQGTDQSNSNPNKVRVAELGLDYTKMDKEIEKVLSAEEKMESKQWWWNMNINELKLQELKKLDRMLEELKNKVKNKAAGDEQQKKRFKKLQSS